MQAANSLTLELEPKAVTAAEDSQDYASITDPVDDHSAGWPAAPGGAGFVSQWGYKVTGTHAHMHQSVCMSGWYSSGLRWW